MTAFDKVVQVMQAETGETVTPDTRLRSLVSDSLEMANLVLELEFALNVSIEDEDIYKLCTVRDIVNYAEIH